MPKPTNSNDSTSTSIIEGIKDAWRAGAERINDGGISFQFKIMRA